jgi:hypothetical protein
MGEVGYSDTVPSFFTYLAFAFSFRLPSRQGPSARIARMTSSISLSMPSASLSAPMRASYLD